MVKMPLQTPGLGKFLSDSTATALVEDHLSEGTWFSLQPTASALSRIFAASQSLWESVS